MNKTNKPKAMNGDTRVIFATAKNKVTIHDINETDMMVFVREGDNIRVRYSSDGPGLIEALTTVFINDKAIGRLVATAFASATEVLKKSKQADKPPANKIVLAKKKVVIVGPIGKQLN